MPLYLKLISKYKSRVKLWCYNPACGSDAGGIKRWKVQKGSLRFYLLELGYLKTLKPLLAISLDYVRVKETGLQVLHSDLTHRGLKPL